MAVAAVAQRRRQLLQLAVFGGARHHALAGAQLHDRARQGIGLDEVGGRLVVHAQACQQGRQRVAGADFFFVDVKLFTVSQLCDLLLQIRQGQVLDDSVDRRIGGVRLGRGEAGGADREGAEEQGAGGQDLGLAGRAVEFLLAEEMGSAVQGGGAREFIFREHAIR